MSLLLSEKKPPSKRIFSSATYVVQALDFGYFKIGSTHDLRARLMGIRWCVPGGLRLVAWWGRKWSLSARELEIDLQARLDRWLVSGEWFRVTIESAQMIERWKRRLPRPANAPISRRKYKDSRAWLAKFYAEAGR